MEPDFPPPEVAGDASVVGGVVGGGDGGGAPPLLALVCAALRRSCSATRAFCLSMFCCWIWACWACHSAGDMGAGAVRTVVAARRALVVRRENRMVEVVGW